MDEIVAELLAKTAARGVWLVDAIAGSSEHKAEVLAAAPTDPSIEPPTQISIEGETYLELADRQIFAQPIGGATLVIVFDERTSLGLIRVRARAARGAIERALAARDR